MKKEKEVRTVGVGFLNRKLYTDSPLAFGVSERAGDGSLMLLSVG